ncbi:hypothetical protein [Amaricoccus tamworthensis]|uniref:hypothetical protein n=1 Tax=Amaricoccus tamworthensis TaxID=57002 RepID=UPI003C7DE80C
MTAPSAQPVSRGLARLALRVVVLVALVVVATLTAHIVRDSLDIRIVPENEQQVHQSIMVGTVAFIVLLALPFVPGAEIGLAMLTAFGAAIVPVVYIGTVLALCLSYTIGRIVPISVLVRFLGLLRMRRAADLVRRAAPLSEEERLTMLLDGAPPRLVALALRRRYLSLALALNIPGNALVGGGGGIALLAGLSGLFAPLPTILAFAIAVCPVPLTIAILGS